MAALLPPLRRRCLRTALPALPFPPIPGPALHPPSSTLTRPSPPLTVLPPPIHGQTARSPPPLHRPHRTHQSSPRRPLPRLHLLDLREPAFRHPLPQISPRPRLLLRSTFFPQALSSSSTRQTPWPWKPAAGPQHSCLLLPSLKPQAITRTPPHWCEIFSDARPTIAKSIRGSLRVESREPPASPSKDFRDNSTPNARAIIEYAAEIARRTEKAPAEINPSTY